MFIIEARNEKSLWISSVFKEIENVHNYLNEIPNNLREVQTILDIDILYPFYVIENNGFSYVTKDELFRILDNIIFDVEDDDNVLFTFYFIPSDYKSKELGDDSMEALPHVHVTGYSMLRFHQYDRESYMKRNGFM